MARSRKQWSMGGIFAVITAAAVATTLSATTPPAHASIGIGTRVLMDTVLPDTVMHNVPIRDAVQYLRNMTGANIFVNWSALNAAGISNITPITLHLRNVTMRKIVSVMLQQASPSAALVDYVSQNVLTITTRQEANLHLTTHVYPVGDLVMTIPNFTAPAFNLQNQGSTTGVQVQGGQGGQGGGGGTGNIFSGNTTGNAATTETTTQRGKQLVALIESTVQPNIWVTNGGPASIVYFNRQLVVSAPIYVQQMIDGGN